MQELVPRLEDMRQDKVHLTELANELGGKLANSRIPDIEHKAADAEDKFSQLHGAITDR